MYNWQFILRINRFYFHQKQKQRFKLWMILIQNKHRKKPLLVSIDRKSTSPLAFPLFFHLDKSLWSIVSIEQLTYHTDYVSKQQRVLAFFFLQEYNELFLIFSSLLDDIWYWLILVYSTSDENWIKFRLLHFISISSSD